MRGADQYEGLRKRLFMNMHRAYNLSMQDGTKMINYYGYDGVYKKLLTMNNDLIQVKKPKLQTHSVKLLHQK
jgi:hypothetical protein